MSDEIPSFVSRGWYRLRGRGWVVSVACDRERPRANSGLVNQRVRVDGEDFVCFGVEMFMPGYPIRQGEMIGLLVKEIS